MGNSPEAMQKYFHFCESDSTIHTLGSLIFLESWHWHQNFLQNYGFLFWLQGLNVSDDNNKEIVELKENRDILAAIPNKEPCLQSVNDVWAVAQASKRIGIAKDDYLSWSYGKNANTWDWQGDVVM